MSRGLGGFFLSLSFIIRIRSRFFLLLYFFLLLTDSTRSLHTTDKSMPRTHLGKFMNFSYINMESQNRRREMKKKEMRGEFGSKLWINDEALGDDQVHFSPHLPNDSALFDSDALQGSGPSNYTISGCKYYIL